MGPKLKKPPRNAYSFFLDDYVEREADRGRRVSKKVAAEECASMWKKLTDEEKEPYIQRAKADKEKEKVNKDNKFTSLGLSYTEKEKQERKEAEWIARMDMEINDTVDGLLPSSTLRTHLFFLVHVNYYCKTTEGMFIPAELAISKFNLEDGVKDTYHILIDPGRVPTGYRFEAQRLSDEIHSLPVPPYEEGEKDYVKILENICNFMKPGKMPNGKLPPLYTIENNLQASRSVMKWVTEAESRYADTDYELFRVYPIEKLFFKLKNHCVGKSNVFEVGFPTISNAIAEIEKDFFAYTVGISCGFHKSDDEKFQNCSLSFVQRFVYMICDHCCQYLDIELIPGRHSQLYCDTKRSSTRGSTAGSLSSRASSSGSRSVCGDTESEFGTTASSYASSIKGGVPSSKNSTYEYSKKDLEKPLKLPKTRSRAFCVTSDMSDMESVVSAGESVATVQDFEGAAALPSDVRIKEELGVDDDDDEDEPPMYCIGRGARKKRSVPEVGRNSLSHDDKKVPRGRGRPIYDQDDFD